MFSLFLTNAPLLYQLKTERKPLVRKYWPDMEWEKFEFVLFTNNFIKSTSRFCDRSDFPNAAFFVIGN